MTSFIRRFATGAVLLIASAAQAAGPPPPPGTPRDFILPPMERLELDNGLAATLIDYGIVPQVTIFAVVAAGNVDEGSQTWLADLVGDELEQGAGDRDAAQFARAAADLGGALAVGVGVDYTSLSLTVLSEHAAAAVALLAKQRLEKEMRNRPSGRSTRRTSSNNSIGRTKYCTETVHSNATKLSAG